jgi:hypothetical protein
MWIIFIIYNFLSPLQTTKDFTKKMSPNLRLCLALWSLCLPWWRLDTTLMVALMIQKTKKIKSKNLVWKWQNLEWIKCFLHESKFQSKFKKYKQLKTHTTPKMNIIDEIFKILAKTPPPKKGSTYKSLSMKKLQNLYEDINIVICS